jgi:hypothetical protein
MWFLLWIFTICIDQDDPEDKRIGIQVMDFVYRRCAAAVGLVSLRISSQELMDDLHHVLEHQGLGTLIITLLGQLMNARRWRVSVWPSFLMLYIKIASSTVPGYINKFSALKTR